MLQTLRGKQKYQVTDVGVEKIKLSLLLVQRINELKQGLQGYSRDPGFDQNTVRESGKR